MKPEAEPDVWKLLFEQTPTALRWALGVLTGGVFTIAATLYRRNQRRMDRIDDSLRVEIRKSEERQRRDLRQLDDRLQETNRLLVDIVRNTHREDGNGS